MKIEAASFANAWEAFVSALPIASRNFDVDTLSVLKAAFYSGGYTANKPVFESLSALGDDASEQDSDELSQRLVEIVTIHNAEIMTEMGEGD